MLPSIAAMAPGSNPELKVCGSALEMVGMVLTKSLLSVLQYRWEVHTMADFIFISAEAKWSSLGNQLFLCFAFVCGTAVAICLALAGGKGQ